MFIKNSVPACTNYIQLHQLGDLGRAASSSNGPERWKLTVIAFSLTKTAYFVRSFDLTANAVQKTDSLAVRTE